MAAPAIAPTETLRYAAGASALGTVLIAASARGIAAILIGEDAAGLIAELHGRFPAATLVVGEDREEALLAAVLVEIETPGADTRLPLDLRGTAFQQRVWQALRQIPAGTTASYTEIAHAIGAPAAVRAVAGACAANAHAVVIPCHRIVRGDGGLSGYRWGVDRKRALLAREAGAPRLL